MARAEEPKAKLGWLLAGEFQCEPHSGPSRLLAQTLAETLRDLGRIELIDEALVDVAALLGESVDADPTNASLWGQFRAALAELRGVGAGGDDDEFAKFLAGLSTDVRDPAQPESPDKGSADRPGRGRTRSAADAASVPHRGRGRGATA